MVRVLESKESSSVSKRATRLLKQYILALRQEARAIDLFKYNRSCEDEQMVLLGSLDVGGHTGYSYDPRYSAAMGVQIEAVRYARRRQRDIKSRLLRIVS